MSYTNVSDYVDYENEQVKILIVFKEGIESLRWGILYREGSTPEEIYNSYLRYFNKEKNIPINSKKKVKKLGEK